MHLEKTSNEGKGSRPSINKERPSSDEQVDENKASDDVRRQVRFQITPPIDDIHGVKKETEVNEALDPLVNEFTSNILEKISDLTIEIENLENKLSAMDSRLKEVSSVRIKEIQYLMKMEVGLKKIISEARTYPTKSSIVEELQRLLTNGLRLPLDQFNKKNSAVLSAESAEDKEQAKSSPLNSGTDSPLKSPVKDNANMLKQFEHFDFDFRSKSSSSSQGRSSRSLHHHNLIPYTAACAAQKVSRDMLDGEKDSRKVVSSRVIFADLKKDETSRNQEPSIDKRAGSADNMVFKIRRLASSSQKCVSDSLNDLFANSGTLENPFTIKSLSETQEITELHTQSKNIVGEPGKNRIAEVQNTLKLPKEESRFYNNYLKSSSLKKPSRSRISAVEELNEENEIASEDNDEKGVLAKPGKRDIEPFSWNQLINDGKDLTEYPSFYDIHEDLLPQKTNFKKKRRGTAFFRKEKPTSPKNSNNGNIKKDSTSNNKTAILGISPERDAQNEATRTKLKRRAKQETEEKVLPGKLQSKSKPPELLTHIDLSLSNLQTNARHQSKSQTKSKDNRVVGLTLRVYQQSPLDDYD